MLTKLYNAAFNVARWVADGASTEEQLLKAPYEKFKEIVGIILPVVLSVLLLIGMFFGINLGIKFARAEDADARDKVKGQLINLAIGIGVAAVIIVICITLVQTDVFKNIFPKL